LNAHLATIQKRDERIEGLLRQGKALEVKLKAQQDQRRRLEEQSNAQLATIQQRDQQIAALERKVNA
jgi:hypothetical protein